MGPAEVAVGSMSRTLAALRTLHRFHILHRSEDQDKLSALRIPHKQADQDRSAHPRQAQVQAVRRGQRSQQIETLELQDIACLPHPIHSADSANYKTVITIEICVT